MADGAFGVPVLVSRNQVADRDFVKEALAKPSRAGRTGGGTAASCGASAPLRPARVVLRRAKGAAAGVSGRFRMRSGHAAAPASRSQCGSSGFSGLSLAAFSHEWMAVESMLSWWTGTLSNARSVKRAKIRCAVLFRATRRTADGRHPVRRTRPPESERAASGHERTNREARPEGGIRNGDCRSCRKL